MGSDPVAAQQQGSARAAALPTTPVARMRAAVDAAVAVGPGFLRGDVDADHMAHTMVQAVRTYAEQERSAGGAAAQGVEARELQNVLGELMACGSGYLAGQCDAACVARTITQMVDEFKAP